MRKGRAVGIVRGVQTLLFDTLPHALNQLEIGRVRGPVEQCDAQGCGEGLPHRTGLIARIVQDEGEPQPRVRSGQYLQSLADRRGGKGGESGDGEEVR